LCGCDDNGVLFWDEVDDTRFNDGGLFEGGGTCCVRAEISGDESGVVAGDEFGVAGGNELAGAAATDCEGAPCVRSEGLFCSP
jgi:hypothetical protein